MRSLLAIVLASFVLLSCSTQKVAQSRNDKLYKKENNELNTKLGVYHISDSVSLLFYDIANDALIYKKNDTSAFFYSHCKLFYRISREASYRPISDSGSIDIYDRQMTVEAKHLSGYMYIRTLQGNAYFSEVTVTDGNKKAQYVYPIYIDKTSKDTRQNFLIRDSRQEIHFNSYFSPGETVYIETQTHPETLYTIDYFYKDFKIAKPPFSPEPMEHFSYKPDSSFSVSKTKNNIVLELPGQGFYHLKTNDATKEGVTLLVFESSYPKISNSEQMVLATRYIMNKKEFDVCMAADDKKTAIDQFWIDIGGSNERARELIRRYYNRVEESNRLFTSYREGWKTDRGMVYIVFGAPSSVAKRKNGEVWTYGDSGNPNSISFSFVKVINPFSDNDYSLERSEILKMPWYQAVDFWRQGRIYLDN